MTASGQEHLPPCPISGKPAKRRVHGVAVSFMKGFWKSAGAGEVGHLFQESGQVVLYESDNGLYFFEPRQPGDGPFYERFYQRHRVHELLSSRIGLCGEFEYATKHAHPAMSLLDVGCGNGALGSLLTNCDYHGLDPYAGPEADVRVTRESLDEHLAGHAGSYDMVVAFHVIEHVPDPVEFASKLTALLKPSGLLVLAAPLAISPHDRHSQFPHECSTTSSDLVVLHCISSARRAPGVAAAGSY